MRPESESTGTTSRWREQIGGPTAQRGRRQSLLGRISRRWRDWGGEPRSSSRATRWAGGIALRLVRSSPRMRKASNNFIKLCNSGGAEGRHHLLSHPAHPQDLLVHAPPVPQVRPLDLLHLAQLLLRGLRAVQAVEPLQLVAAHRAGQQVQALCQQSVEQQLVLGEVDRQVGHELQQSLPHLLHVLPPQQGEVPRVQAPEPVLLRLELVGRFSLFEGQRLWRGRGRGACCLLLVGETSLDRLQAVVLVQEHEHEPVEPYFFLQTVVHELEDGLDVGLAQVLGPEDCLSDPQHLLLAQEDQLELAAGLLLALELLGQTQPQLLLRDAAQEQEEQQVLGSVLLRYKFVENYQVGVLPLAKVEGQRLQQQRQGLPLLLALGVREEGLQEVRQLVLLVPTAPAQLLRPQPHRVPREVGRVYLLCELAEFVQGQLFFVLSAVFAPAGEGVATGGPTQVAMPAALAVLQDDAVDETLEDALARLFFLAGGRLDADRLFLGELLFLRGLGAAEEGTAQWGADELLVLFSGEEGVFLIRLAHPIRQLQRFGSILLLVDEPQALGHLHLARHLLAEHVLEELRLLYQLPAERQQQRAEPRLAHLHRRLHVPQLDYRRLRLVHKPRLGEHQRQHDLRQSRVHAGALALDPRKQRREGVELDLARSVDEEVVQVRVGEGHSVLFEAGVGFEQSDGHVPDLRLEDGDLALPRESDVAAHGEVVKGLEEGGPGLSAETELVLLAHVEELADPGAGRVEEGLGLVEEETLLVEAETLGHVPGDDVAVAHRAVLVDHGLAEDGLVEHLVEAELVLHALLLPHHKLMRPRTISDDIKTRFLVGVAGGSASGKTSICSTIAQMMTLERGLRTVSVPLDCFYKDLEEGADPSKHNFDHPDALDMELAKIVLRKLKNGEPAQIPIYNFKTNRREGWTTLPEAELILFEGIFVLNNAEIRQLMQMRIFVTCDNDIRLCRRVHRDISERGRTYRGVVTQYMRFVRPAYHDFIEPMMKYANLIIPSTTDNHECVMFIVQNLLAVARAFAGINSQEYFFGNMLYFRHGEDPLLADNYLVNYSAPGRVVFVTEERIKSAIMSALSTVRMFDDHREEYVLKFIKYELVYYGVVMLKRLLQTLPPAEVQFVEYGACLESGPAPGKQVVTLCPVRAGRREESWRNRLQGVIAVSLLGRVSTLEYLRQFLRADWIISILLTRSATTDYERVLGNHRLVTAIFEEQFKHSTSK